MLSVILGFLSKKRHLLLLATFLLFLGFLIYPQTSPISYVQSYAGQDSFFSFLGSASFMLSFSIAVVVLVKLANQTAFRSVFGKRMLNDDYTVSLPMFEFSKEANDILNEAGLLSSRERLSAIGTDTKYKSGDVPHIIASGDIKGAAFLIDAVGEFSRRGPKFEFGTALTDTSESCLAFGLQTNPTTQWFIRDILGASAMRRIPLPAGEKKLLPAKALDIRNNRFALNSISMEQSEDKKSADIVIQFVGTKNSVKLQSTHKPDWHFGLVVIHRPKSGVRKILCAGIGHAGTDGASYHLSKNWRTYSKLFNRLSPFSNEYETVLSITVTPINDTTGGVPKNEKLTGYPDQTVELARFGRRKNG